ncbi:MAG: DUF1294 domain-containing protein [Peptococcaceae bacterium]|nr:DUF1294 domain-containing protein [Peptococcaceae bacterium]
MLDLITRTEWPIVCLYIYLIGINVYAFLNFGWDKFKAKKHKRRTAERFFLFLALIGGAPGILLGMWIFRHKTKHAKFKYGVPLLFVFNLALFYYIFYFLDLISA